MQKEVVARLDELIKELENQSNGDCLTQRRQLPRRAARPREG